MRHTAETISKLSAMRRGERNPFFGKKHRPEVVAAMRARAKIQNAARQYDIHPVGIKIPEPALCAYIAGLVDGEGSIVFKREQPVVVIYNCHLGVIEWLKTTVGGSYRVAHRNGRTPNYSWSIGGARNCNSLICAMLPYLIIKRDLGEEMRSRLRAKYGERIDG